MAFATFYSSCLNKEQNGHIQDKRRCWVAYMVVALLEWGLHNINYFFIISGQTILDTSWILPHEHIRREYLESEALLLPCFDDEQNNGAKHLTEDIHFFLSVLFIRIFTSFTPPYIYMFSFKEISRVLTKIWRFNNLHINMKLVLLYLT